jgi:2-oxoglutarate ferredoxin oxidoreductase subunit alpha
MKRIRIKVTGESGSGLLSTGEIIMRGLQALGFYVVADREYPSLIKGGQSCFLINASLDPIYALEKEFDILLCIDKPSMLHYYKQIGVGKVFIHGYERLLGIQEVLDHMQEKDVKVINLAAREIAENCGGNVLMTNVVLIGALWKALNFDYKKIEAQVKWKFASKPKLLALDLKCLEAGYQLAKVCERLEEVSKLSRQTKAKDLKLMNGNKALALGAVHAGTQAYIGYPMSPSSSILMHMAEFAAKKGFVVKQAEDEISVANMCLGAMYMGTRALTATSGGGFDLMSETISLAGITETPLVIIIAQRPGPGTGLPTWTAQGDLQLAINAGHGEYGRMVIGVSDPEDCFELIQHAYNYAEEYQVPVVVLTEKLIAETNFSITKFEENTVPIKRGLVSGEDLEKLENSDRYKITESGVSKRWAPGSSDAYYFANGDEHWEDGSLTEEENAGEMYAKRLRKLETIEKALPDPVIYGGTEGEIDHGAEISFIGWGSSKNVMRDAIRKAEEDGIKVNYLHFSYLWPLKTEKLEQFFDQNNNVHLIEGNATGQLGQLITSKLNVNFAGKLLKWNGRPFFVDEVLEYINEKYV